MKEKREVRSKNPGLKRAFKRAAVSACAAAAVSLALAVPAFAACGPVVLDAGHGGGDSGAVGNGLTESNLTWRITKYAEERLKQLGIPTVMARASENSNPSLYQRNKARLLEQAADAGLLSAEELWTAKRLALERYRPATVWE